MSRNLSLGDLGVAERGLVEAARDAAANAYAPYSNFSVGAAVRTKSGKVYTGANLENASYGTTICAEMAAAAAANTAGDFDIEAIAITGRKTVAPLSDKLIVTPCGRCRQIIFEASQVAATDVKVLSCNGDLSSIMEATIGELLPSAFGPANLGVLQEARKQAKAGTMT